MARFSISGAMVFGLGIVSCFTNVSAQYIDPNDDPFYAVPTNVATYTAGAVISSRSVPTPQETLNVAGSYQLLYRTTNQQGNATATVATVWAPGFPKSPPKILLYSAAYDSLNIDCVPSWLFANNSASHAASYINVEASILVPWAMTSGFYVVNTDAAGPNSALLVGNLEGRAALDGVKAAINYKKLARPSVALYGYSGGAHTTIWAANLATTGYAPQFDVVGAAYGGTPTDLNLTYNLLDNTNSSALIAATIFGLGNGYPEVNQTIKNLLTPLGKQVSTSVRRRNNCLPNDVADNAGVPQSIESMFTKGPRGIPLFESVLKNESLTSTASPYPIPVPTFPRLEYHGYKDITVSYQGELDYVNQQCNSGKKANIWFQTFKTLDHGESGIFGLVGALAFVGNALNGIKQNPPTCGAPTTIFAAPGSTNATNVLGQSLAQTLCDLCQCCPWTS